jgi:hypothetical protein
MMSLAYRFLRAKSPEQRAHVDLDTHYTKVTFSTFLIFSSKVNNFEIKDATVRF